MAANVGCSAVDAASTASSAQHLAAVSDDECVFPCRENGAAWEYAAAAADDDGAEGCWRWRQCIAAAAAPSLLCCPRFAAVRESEQRRRRWCGESIALAVAAAAPGGVVLFARDATGKHRLGRFSQVTSGAESCWGGGAGRSVAEPGPRRARGRDGGRGKHGGWDKARDYGRGINLTEHVSCL